MIASTIAAPTALDSNIRAVTVYRSGANVIREARFPTVEGSDNGVVSLRFDDLPLSLVDSSLRCRVTGAGTARATELRCELRLPDAKNLATAGQSEERKALEVKVEQLRGRIRFIQEEIALKLTLGERGKPADGDAPMKSPLLARVETLRVLGERAQKLDAEMQEVSEELRLAEKALVELVQVEALASTDREARAGEMRKSVVVYVQGAGQGPGGRIELDYFVPGARWAPAYALRLAANLQEGELAMRAMVSQRSGEDWHGVTLTLSTADHQNWAEIPELNSKRIGRRQPSPPKKGWRAPPIGTDSLYRDYDANFGGPAAPFTVGGLAVDGLSMKEELRRDEAPAPYSATVLGDYDDEEYTEEMVPSEEFDGATTAVMEEVSFEADLGAPAAAPVMASMAKIALAPRRSKSKKRPSPRLAMPEMAGNGPGSYGGGAVPRRAPEKPAGPQVDLDLLQYTRLRMGGPDSRSRGSLRICTELEVYAEIFAEHGEELDAQSETQLEMASYRAHDIAAMPTGHSEPWSEDFDYAYRAANTVDVESDGQYHSLPITQDRAICAPLHVVVPRENTDVFRTVKVDNPMDAPLLAGPLDVYWDDAFLLTSAVAFTAPMGQVELGLGVDQAVKVVRNTHYREDTAGLMGGSLALSHKIVIEVANEGNHEIALEVRERVPVAAKDEDDIKLDIKSVSPSWSAFEPETKDARERQSKGVYRWLLPLAAGERKEFNATYEIKMPSKYELQGGNRREW